MTDADTVEAVPKAKIAITIDEDLLAKVKRKVANGIAPNVSAFIEAAVAERLESRAAFMAMVDEMLEETGGPITEDEAREIDREFGWA